MSKSELLLGVAEKIGQTEEQKASKIKEIKRFLLLPISERLKMAEEALKAYDGNRR